MAAKNRQRKNTSPEKLTAGTVITFEEPKSSRKKEPKLQAVVEEINPVEGFADFLRQHAIVGLSIGFIIGNQMAGFVRILVEKIIDPLTLLVFGTKLSQRSTTVEFNGREAIFGWGLVVYNIIIIMLLLIVIYAAVKIFALDKLVKKDDKDNK